MNNKKLEFKKVKDGAKKVGVSDLGIEIKAHNGDLLECYEPKPKDKDTPSKK